MSLARLARIVRQRLRSIARRDTADTALDRELSFHFDQLVGEYEADGLSAGEARQAARRAFGNAALLADQSRDTRRVNWFYDLAQDGRHALRGFLRQPGFAVIAVISLGLGIGANAAVIAARQSANLEALPFPEPARLVAIRTRLADNPQQAGNATIADYLAWRARSQVIESAGASINWQMDFGAETEAAPAERIIGQAVTGSLFATLGTIPLKGRWFAEEESRLNHPVPVVMLSYKLWQRRYAGDPDILSKSVRLDGVLTAIVGVMPQRFRYSDRRAEFWVPLRINPEAANSQAGYAVIARLKPGAGLEQAQAELETIGVQPTTIPERQRRAGVRVDLFRDVMYDWAGTPFLTLQAAVVFLLLIACANVVSLQIGRGAARHREMALRAALGASRGRLIRQLLAENALIAAAGGLVGIAIAAVGIRALAASMSPPPGSPHLMPMILDARTVGVTGVITLVALVIIGLAPAVSFSRLRLSPLFFGLNAAVTQRSRSMLVAIQIAWALILLAGAGLLITSFVRQLHREMNFDERGLLSFEYHVPGFYTKPIGTYHGYPYVEMTRWPADEISRVYERLARTAGAEAVAGISHPLVNSLVVPTAGVMVDGELSLGSSMYFLVTPHFFSTIRATLVAGRDFDERDSAASAWTTVVNETAARRLWPDGRAIGRRLTLDTVPEEQPREVIGVVRDMPIRRKQIEAQPVIYVSYLQQPRRYRAPLTGVFGQMTFLLRRDADPASLLPEARRAVAEINADRPLFNAAVLTDLPVPLVELRNYVGGLGGFALAATLLAAIGVYGVAAFSVTQRTREIGVRRALGAGTREIAALVSRGAIVSAAAGLGLGLAGTFLLTRLLASQLWGVTPTDAITLGGASGMLAVVSVVACAIPARRALRVDPTVALKIDD